MATNKEHTRICILFLYLALATISFYQCEARRSMRLLKAVPSPAHQRSLFLKAAKNLKLIKQIDFPLEGSKEIQPYGVSSPLTLPPYDSLAPISLPENAPPYCTTAPNTPQTPSAIFTPTPSTPYPPILPIQSPPGSPTIIIPGPPESISTPNPPVTFPSPTIIIPGPPESTPNPPVTVPSPTIIIPGPPESTPNPPVTVPSPTVIVPSPPDFIPSPTIYIPSPPDYEPSPPALVPNPPFSVPSPFGFQPSPPVFEPPIIFPPPTTPPTPKRGPKAPLWCVAKPSVPDPIIQEAMNYACGSGADCGPIQPSGPCFEPNSLFAHASYAFNSFWQRTKVAGGTCEFGGTGMLVTVDPSYDGCHFVYY
ncbi:PREDICTED: glucan endo-1 3-beta-glucosidase [Prunus dulcis]|uniref:PREDICTED: glucan endo-1 3-beta-glucosidase n=1 Tax=Prunus dulcis TaxID=3755 RepID=A0A5E4FGE0_PRUDU|nr:pollen-specific leucine-rich repeat extensin-like protein 1 [Prunus dulcis]VVA26965.1 PREDICTED: glucan endo-1 3-beta-glucosidase [Prunus dulcis]